jgi:hypothetical protein
VWERDCPLPRTSVFLSLIFNAKCDGDLSPAWRNLDAPVVLMNYDDGGAWSPSVSRVASFTALPLLPLIAVELLGETAVTRFVYDAAAINYS